MRQQWQSDKFITLSPHWDYTVPEAFSVEGMRARFKAVATASRDVARWLARTYPGTGVWLILEMVDGFIHAHLLFRGPFVPHATLRAYFESRLATVELNGVVIASGAGGARIEKSRGIKEVTKYNTKSSSPFDEDWMDGEQRPVTHPVLVARWQTVTHGARLTDAYGELRQAWQDAGEDEDEEEAATLEEAAGVAAVTEDEPPCSCGAHAWKWNVGSLRAWIRWCHRRGMPALHGSRWKPPPAARHGARHARSTIVEV